MATFMNESIIIGSDRGTTRGPWPGVALVLALALVAVGSWVIFGKNAPLPDSVPITPVSTSTPSAKPIVSSVDLVLLDASGEGGGEQAGCDTLKTVSVAVSPTQDPVTAALEALFENATTTDLMPGNFVGNQPDLQFDRAVAVEGDVQVYLVGTVAYAGVCDDPRLQIQIEETVLANAPDTDEVQIFVNGEAYEMPNEKGE
jgi:hypothetical protein